MKIAILSDIHGNLTACMRVLEKLQDYKELEGILLLGDLIDYGMKSNEVIQEIKKINLPILCNIRGNHEAAIFSDQASRFSSERGRLSSAYTKSILTEETKVYITSQMSEAGFCEFSLDGKKCLAIHGSLKDEYWKSISPKDDLSPYKEYDYVFSGHSHRPNMFEEYFQADDKERRNQKKTIFINPGSVGQPRNLIPMAQFVVLDTKTEECRFVKVCYDVEKEQSYFTDKVDEFYKNRLTYGV